jgi:hypothetical protein
MLNAQVELKQERVESCMALVAGVVGLWEREGATAAPGAGSAQRRLQGKALHVEPRLTSG